MVFMAGLPGSSGALRAGLGRLGGFGRLGNLERWPGLLAHCRDWDLCLQPRDRRGKGCREDPKPGKCSRLEGK